MCAAATQENIVNHTVLLLCSEIQNIGKTTFINNLLPPELRAYLSTGLINSNNKDDLAKITQAMLINLDEFEGMSGRELNAFKDLVTRKVISFRLPYARRSQNFPHTASFAGTCNYQEVLHDTTGNRRFLCFHPYSIQFITINYAQLYAQIKYLLNKPGTNTGSRKRTMNGLKRITRLSSFIHRKKWFLRISASRNVLRRFII